MNGADLIARRLAAAGCRTAFIGFKYAMPEAPVVVFTGDAGLEMVLGELATLRDLGLPLAIVVFVDSSLALIEMRQRRSGLQNAGVDFQRTDFALLARVYGGLGLTVSGPGEAGPGAGRGAGRRHLHDHRGGAAPPRL